MSTWYRTGTVSVTNGSKNVVGTGTAWSVMISVGDVFTLDNSVLYEIQTITDDLHIVLDRNYEGATETDQTYTIIPWSVKRSLNSEILDRINKLLEWAHEVFVTQWTTDTNGDYEVSTTLDKNIVPKVNNGASLGTTLKKWAKAYLTALSINGVDILPTTTPTASSVPISDETGKIDSGWLPEIPDATTETKGVVKVGTNLSATNGVISVPDASETVKGVVGVGDNLNVTDGVISVPEATVTVPGVDWRRSPIGSIIIYPVNDVPDHCLECNGAEISRETYSDLFAVLGITYGAGDGSTTFKIPDLRGEFIRGFDSGRGIDSGRSIGSPQSDAFKSHTHLGMPKGITGAVSDFFGGSTEDFGFDLTDNTGAQGDTETRPRNIAMMYCIVYE